jgi:hypothetical protein
VFPLNDFEQMNVDLNSNSNGSEYLDSVSDCESDSVKIQNYLEDFSCHNNFKSP